MQHPHPGWFEGLTHCLPIRIYYEDTDMSGIVYHANYVRYFERGRTEFLRAAGITHTDLRLTEQPIAFAVIRMEIDFKKAARIDDALVVRTRFHDMKGVRFYARQSIQRDGVSLCEAMIQAVCIDLDGRARRMPKSVADGLQQWISPPDV